MEKEKKKEPCVNKIPSRQDLFGALLLGSVLWMRYLEGDIIGTSLVLIIITLFSLGNVVDVLINKLLILVNRTVRGNDGNRNS